MRGPVWVVVVVVLVIAVVVAVVVVLVIARQNAGFADTKFDSGDPWSRSGSNMEQNNGQKIHVRVQQMGKKWITTLEGLDDDLDLKRIARAMKKSLHCSVNVTDAVIQLQGDHRMSMNEWLVVNEVLTASEAADRLIIHGA